LITFELIPRDRRGQLRGDRHDHIGLIKTAAEKPRISHHVALISETLQGIEAFSQSFTGASVLRIWTAQHQSTA